MFATPEALPAPINLPNSFQATPWLSADGLTLYFSSDRPGGQGGIDLWVAERNSIDDPWNAPINLGPPINTARADLGPSLSADGLTLYFMDGNPFGVAPRAGGPGNYQIWTAKRATKQSPWENPEDLQSPVGSRGIESYPHLASDGLALYFTSDRSTPDGLFVSTRLTEESPWGTPTNLGPAINQGSWSGFPHLSSSGLHLFFETDRPGGRGGFDLWMSTRSAVQDAWPTPVNLGAQINGSFFDVSPCVSADFPALGSYLLFARNDTDSWTTRFKIYRAEVIPNLTVLRASSLDQDGAWTPTTATFTKVSANSIQSEVTIAAANEAFYRVSMAGGGGTVHIESSERVGNKLRLRYTWAQ